jgi:hypothetical protein
MPSILIRENPILSSERLLPKDYDRKGLVAKKSPVVSLERLGTKMN